MNIASLFARIGIKSDTKPAENLLDKLKGIKIGLGVATVGAGVFVAALKRITDEAFNTALALKKFKVETGASVEELQKWTAVADEVSGAGQAVSDSIKAITSNQEKIKLGQGNISGYQLLGINPNQDPFKILEALRTKTAGLSQGMKKNVLDQMGVSRDLISVLELTNAQFNEMASKAFIIPQSALTTIDQARASTKQLEGGLKYFKAMLTAELAPSIIKINNLIMEWIRNNKDGLIKNIKTAFDWLTKFVGAGINTVKMINSVISGTIGWANAFKILIGVIAILNASLLLSPIGLITAGIILLVAVLDDFYVYSKGGKSLMGEMAKSSPEFKKMLDSVVELAKAMKNLFSGDWADFDKLMDKWGAFGDIISGIINGLAILKSMTTNDPEEYAKTKRGKQVISQYEEIRNVNKEKGTMAAFQTWLKQGMSVDVGNYMRALKDEPFFKNEKQTSGSTVINNNYKTDIKIQGDVDKKVYDDMKKELKTVDSQMGYQE